MRLKTTKYQNSDVLRLRNQIKIYLNQHQYHFEWIKASELAYGWKYTDDVIIQTMLHEGGSEGFILEISDAKDNRILLDIKIIDSEQYAKTVNQQLIYAFNNKLFTN